MAYFKPKQFQDKREFFLDRLSMSLGSLANLYSHSQNPPTPEKLFEEAVEITDKMWSYGKRFDPFPELDEKLNKRFEEEHEKKIGRYNSSELWALFNNRIKPEDYLKPRVFDEESKKKMYWGTIVHEGIQKLFGFEEKKYEIKVSDDITIVCKIDLELEDKIFEFKTRENIESFDNVPDWYNLQCQSYLQAKNLKECYLYLIGWGLTRKLFVVKRDERIWDYIKEEIKKYHNRVVKVNQE